MSDEELSLAQAATTGVTAICPICDRSEDFDDEMVARAWMNGHIQSQHTDELPKFINERGESE